MSKTVGVWMVLASVVLGACGIASEDALLARAPSDLSCPKESLRTRTTHDAIGHGKTVVVEGCGKSQTYVAVCNGTDLGSTCTWLKN